MMKSRLMWVSVLVGLFSLVNWLPAQEKKENPFDKLPKPGPEHKRLESLVGKYDAKVKSWIGAAEPKISSGTLVREMVMDGRYLHERFKGDFEGVEFKGMGIIAYDLTKKKYVMAWIDNFGTGIELNTGTYDEASKSYTFLGEADHPDFGGKMKTRDVLKIINENEQIFEMFRLPEKLGKEMKVMEITYTRKQK